VADETETGAADGAPAEKLQIDGITDTDYAFWRQHPVTRMHARYMLDRQRDFIAAAVDRWMAQALTLSDEHELRGFAKCLGECADTPFVQIWTFYQQLKQLKREQDGQDDPGPPGRDDDA
jgi:hypothetical protein